MEYDKPSRYTILYDGDCPMCTALIERVDNSSKKERFDKLDITKHSYPSFEKNALRKEIHIVDNNGAVYKGSEGILKIIDQYPQWTFVSRIGRLPVISEMLSVGYKIVAAQRHFLFGPSSKLFWFKNFLILVLLSSMLLSTKLWVSSRYYPLSPVVSGLPPLPYPLDYVLFIAVLISLAAALVWPRPRKFIIASVAGLAVLAFLDQSRWQPEFYQFFFMIIAVSLFSWNWKDSIGQKRALITCQLIIGCIYVWSGLQKLNPGFIGGIFPWMVGPFIHAFPAGGQSLILSLGILAPFIEVFIGISLVTKRFRKWGVVLAIVMHLFILCSVGPVGHDWNSVVWPWDIGMIIFVIILFWNDRTSFREIVFNRKSPFHYVVLVLFGVMPLFSFFGLWDSWPSFSIYSGNTNEALIVVDDASFNALPAVIKTKALPIGPDRNAINIPEWSLAELNVPFYPEDRVFKNVGKWMCLHVLNPSTVELRIGGKPYLLTGAQMPTVYTCSDLMN